MYIQNATTVVYLGLTRESYSGIVRSQIMQQPATKGRREEILPLSFNWSSNHTTLFKVMYSSVNPQDFSFLGAISFVQSFRITAGGYPKSNLNVVVETAETCLEEEGGHAHVIYDLPPSQSVWY